MRLDIMQIIGAHSPWQIYALYRWPSTGFLLNFKNEIHDCIWHYSM